MEKSHNSHATVASHEDFMCLPIGVKPLMLILCLLLTYSSAGAQIHYKEHSQPIDVDSVRREFDKGPYFTLYKH